jgi:hypothetical protein
MLTGSPKQITLVAMGDSGINRTDEDEVCAIHLRNRLQAVRAIGGPFNRSSRLVGKSPGSTIRPGPICIPRMPTSRSTSTAMISPSSSNTRMADQSLGSRSQLDRGCDRTGLTDPRGNPL